MICRGCLEPAEVPWHARCARSLFGTAIPPTLDLDVAHLHTAALAMVGHTSLSGVQRKISLDVSPDRSTLQVAVRRARFVLKPQAGTFPSLPENEHVTMRLAADFGLEVPPFGLVDLRDGSLAYLVARFDRPATGGKLRMEDFCQLDAKRPKEKYEGSGELCIKIVRRYASEPGVAVLQVFRQLVFAWWTGNGDLHLKNLSLLCGPDGVVRLSPAYDLLCTRLVIRDDPLALSIDGRRDRLDAATWRRFGEYAKLPTPAVARVLATPAANLDRARERVAASWLPDEMKAAYVDLLAERAARLA